ncbi:SGNH/GDSL hydrolase family protein [Zhouia sp. PK063]|uniref:SGNH/GDSL hydrolase family protein n=1 Tax=Zhouia sp. PK063 TaxID=3373602 RepID=UPI003789EBA0
MFAPTRLLFFIGALLLLNSCNAQEDTYVYNPPANDSSNTSNNNDSITADVKYLALGDSYTIGESVCETCRYPQQLKAALLRNGVESVDLKIIAQTGWTTRNLSNGIDAESPSSDYDLVTLLIGVNNQYQHQQFSVYEKEFPELLKRAIAFAKGDASHVIVISIPDYAYTPFGENSANNETISEEIDQYNSFASQEAYKQNVLFVNITDITRNGLNNPDLVASDGLHPSKQAYSQFVDRLLPRVLDILNVKN